MEGLPAREKPELKPECNPADEKTTVQCNYSFQLPVYPSMGTGVVSEKNRSEE